GRRRGVEDEVRPAMVAERLGLEMREEVRLADREDVEEPERRGRDEDGEELRGPRPGLHPRLPAVAGPTGDGGHVDAVQAADLVLDARAGDEVGGNAPAREGP